MKRCDFIPALLRTCLICTGINSAMAFTVPQDIATDDYLLANIITPANSDPLFYSALLKNSLELLHSYQKSVENCAKNQGKTEGCDSGKAGIPKQGMDNSQLISTSIVVNDGVITVYPSVSKNLPINLSNNIVATPQYNNGSISWDYSGTLFDYDKIKHYKKSSTDSLTCPDPASFPPSFRNFRYFVDLQGIKYLIKGNKSLTANDDPISFLWAAYPGEKNSATVACVYKIGNNPSLGNDWFSLITLDEIAEVPQEGLWNSAQIGVCPTTNTLSVSSVKPDDCPFKLKMNTPVIKSQ